MEMLPTVAYYLYWRYWKVRKQIDSIKKSNIPFYPSAETDKPKLDVYLPTRISTLAPVIFFIYGGSWSSGNKLMYTLLADTLRKEGYMVVVPDYRKYPEVKIAQIYEDVTQALLWTRDNAKHYGGDPSCISIMGHSAGAHLAAQMVLDDIRRKVEMQTSTADTTALPPVQHLILLAGVYDIGEHYLWETYRGVEEISGMSRVMGSTPANFDLNSPTCALKSVLSWDLKKKGEFVRQLPPTLVVHGQHDYTVPVQSANKFHTVLQEIFHDINQHVEYKYLCYPDMNHSDPVFALMPTCWYHSQFYKPLLDEISNYSNKPSREN
ncbi:alpha/beta-hydrolase [Basidiobolus meristosporus CBS 931.73]|uniref:Alpha/beta-hydrolase n=1 Tax=Basidiobolus meristosporus CBS 931.73 TaxID=1314790 RepID=A0A1Y1Y4S5_9FUNG|nr:alpha/beta-hydrolase [Basidiobolus meristosporus CBS 931.73]|eukprot:ORX92949.1 alpha/beta-hydrolase [Basidiobolus meristosporus CBS 931.73]